MILRSFQVIKIKMSNAVYVLFNKSAPQDGFMVGSHTGTLDELITKYIITIPNVMIRCFIETSDANSIVHEFRLKHIKDRTRDCRRNLSDWFTINYPEIIASLVLLDSQYNNNESTLIIYRIEEPIVIETIEEPKKLDIIPQINNPNELLLHIIDLYCKNTKGTQNVKVVNFCTFIREHQRDFSDESIKDIMNNLGHKIGIDPSDRRHLGYPPPGLERFMNLSWTHEIKDKFPILCESWITLPPPVIQKTINSNDYIRFFRDNIKPVYTVDGLLDNTFVVTLDELFNTFCKCYYDQEFGTKLPTKTEFKEIAKCMLDFENKWYGVRLNTQASAMSSILDF